MHTPHGYFALHQNMKTEQIQNNHWNKPSSTRTTASRGPTTSRTAQKSKIGLVSDFVGSLQSCYINRASDCMVAATCV